MTAEPWGVEFERRADRDLDRLDPQVKQRVLAAIGDSLTTREAPISEGSRAARSPVFGSAIGV